MVKPSGNRVIYFLFGITLGLLVGAGFFIFKIDEYISRMELFNQTQSDSLALIEKTSNISEDKNTGKTASYVQNEKEESGVTDSSHTNKNYLPTDSFFADSLYHVSKLNEDQMEVKKDELISGRTVLINGPASSPKNPKDSVMQSISGIRDDKNLPSNMAIEFWISPINYKGYKMTKNKLVLFGLSGNAEMSLHRVDGTLLLRHDQTVYRIELTDDFRSLEKVNDPELISKIQ